MQSQRSLVPEISGVHDWQDLIALTSELETCWALDPDATETETIETSNSACLLVGPEGGWEEAERGDMVGMGCRSLALGPRILRTETAAVVGSTLLLTSGDRGRV